MANFVEKIEEAHLNCSVCLETYMDPKQLQCHHVFCKKCLVNLVIQDQQGHNVLLCPECRQVTPVPARGVSGLQAAFNTNKLLEIVNEHKNKPTSSHCPEHDGKEKELCCETCGEIICWKCTKRGEKHHNHEYKELKEITSLLEPAEKQLKIISEALELFNIRDSEIEDQHKTIEAAVERNIKSTKEQLCKALDARKTKLIEQLHQLTQIKQKSLEKEKEKLETKQEDLRSMKKNLETEIQGVEELIKSTSFEKMKKLTDTVQPDFLEPSTEADITISLQPATQDLLAKCQNYGTFQASGSPDPTKCYLEGNGVDAVEVEEKSTIVLQVKNFNNKPCKEMDISTITSDLVSEITGIVVQGITEEKGQSRYEISFLPEIKGNHQLHIKVRGQHITGSPFLVRGHAPVEKLGELLHIIGDIQRPEGVAVNKKGEIVVTERLGHCVSVYSPSGVKLRSFGSQGSEQGHFHDPFGLALDEDDNIIISDCNNDRIQKFTAQGEFITAVGTQGANILQFRRPRGITVHPCNGRVYVVDGRNRRVQILNSDLSYCSQFGQEGTGEGEFKKPRHIACDSSGYIYVADMAEYNNHRVQVFTDEGKFVRIFKTNDWELQEPFGIAIDSSDRVYISERGRSCVSVFKVAGDLVKSFGSWGSGKGHFRYPGGLAVDDNGVLYVCDCANGRVPLY